MKRKINLYLCFIAYISIMLTSTLIPGVIWGYYSKHVQDDFKSKGLIIAKSYQLAGDIKYLSEIKKDHADIRITLVEPGGKVIFESHSDSESLENHSDRPEIVAAQKFGSGQATRYSNTMGESTYYYAILLENGEVLRVAQSTGTIWAIYAKVFPVVIGIGIMIIFICVWLSTKITNTIIVPIERAYENIDDSTYQPVYDELVPFFRKIRQQNQKINKQINVLKAERDKIQLITENMKEGFILLDKNKSILSINSSAISLLHAQNIDYKNKNILSFIRDQELIKAINSALAGTGRSVVIKQQGRFHEFFVSPVYSDSKVTGAIMLILDITAKEEFEKVRREFTANVSHELKTPLTSISGFAEIIESGMAKPEDIKRFAGKIRTESARLILLIEDIINLSELDEMPYGQNFERINLLQVAKDSVQLLEFPAEQKKINMQVKGDEVFISGNRKMLEELIFNLCDNAIKYNNIGGRVDVEIKKQNDSALIIVSDNGIGIEKEHQHRIFERFYRVDKSRTKSTGGTGLGLSIALHIVRLHQGTITLRSKKYQGTVVTVNLPIAGGKNSSV